MTPALARRLGKAVALLGSPQDGEVIAAVRAIGRTLETAGMDWHGFADLVAGEAARQAAPAFSFAGSSPRQARKLMGHLARQPATTIRDRVHLEAMRERLMGAIRLTLTPEEILWLDRLWRVVHGGDAARDRG